MTNNGFVRGFARGGRNRDNIPAMLMGGEYVVNKRSVDKYGVGLFNDLNNGRAQGFANGGMVGGDGGGVGGAPTTANNNFEINITMNGNGEGETTTSSNQNENQSQEDQERNEQLEWRSRTPFKQSLSSNSVRADCYTAKIGFNYFQ